MYLSKGMAGIGFWGYIKWLGIWTDLRWALLAALAPEYILAMSIFDLVQAREDLKRLHATFSDAQHTWTLTHMFYANMGGFVMLRDGQPWPLQGKHIKAATAKGFIAENAPISVEEIMDKSKTDLFGKVLSMIQLVYFYITFFARIAQNLPVSQLELGVAGVALFSFAAYACYWYKPKSVQTPTVVHPVSTDLTLKDWKMLFGNETSPPDVSNWSEPSRGSPGWVTAGNSGVLVFGTAALGGIHLWGWNFRFPGTADIWLWRASSLYVASTGLLFLIDYGVEKVEYRYRLSGGYSKSQKRLLAWDHVFGMGVMFYAVARLILIAEMFRCLFFLPPAAFQTISWTTIIPHFG